MPDKLYRVILIDPSTRHISELQSDCSLAAIHELIGVATLSQFALADFGNGQKDFGWVDDGGLARGKLIHAFLLPTAKDPIAGKCLIIGANARGQTADCRMPIEILQQDTTWLGLILPEVVWDYTDHGARAIVTYSRVM